MSNNTLKVDYVGKIKNRQLYNIKQVRDSINSKSMQLKICNFADNNNLNKKYVEQKIMNDYVFATHFAISPGRQSYHEEIASEYIASIECIDKFIKLPSSGKGAKYISPFGISIGEKSDGIMSKSIDFEIQLGDNVIYVSHKYTKDDGGAQDNQFNDIIWFIRESKALKKTTLKNENVFFLAIVDGPYYQRNNRIDKLRNEAENLIEVCTIEELEDLLISRFVNKLR